MVTANDELVHLFLDGKINFLDIVTEDGHGFRVYFLYTLLSLPKIFSKILPFIYFVSLFCVEIKIDALVTH